MSVTCIRSHVGLHVSKIRFSVTSFPCSPPQARNSSVTKVRERSLNLVPRSSSVHFIETRSQRIKHCAAIATTLWSVCNAEIWRNKISKFKYIKQGKIKINLYAEERIHCACYIFHTAFARTGNFRRLTQWSITPFRERTRWNKSCTVIDYSCVPQENGVVYRI